LDSGRGFSPSRAPSARVPRRRGRQAWEVPSAVQISPGQVRASHPRKFLGGGGKEQGLAGERGGERGRNPRAELQRRAARGSVPPSVPGDEPAAGALQELPARQLQIRSAVQIRARVLSAAATAAAGEAQPVWVRLGEQAAAAAVVRFAVSAAAATAEAQPFRIRVAKWAVPKRSWPG